MGTVSDPSGAALPSATVTITSSETGSKRTAKTDDAGRFNFPHLRPGFYTVRAEAEGFESQAKESIFSGLGQKQIVNFTLKLSAAKEEVTVTAEVPVVNPENPNTATMLNAPSLENLPNPGGDMTYPLQFAPGALMNTAGSANDFIAGTNGHGNVQCNGLPALSNGYIVDGLETNDPLTNLNSGLSTNLVLGLNSIAEVTVNTLSYTVDQGRYGASQVNYITKSGTNQLHGNLYELWNGSRFNAADFFTDATPGNHKPRSTVNHFGGSLGGPIIHDKLFFFFDSEWVRIDYNINVRNTTWFRFQADTGLQAAYTDPINPLFNAISPQPLYSFAGGYTHIFSSKLVNYFNPAFSWYESLFGRADFGKTLSAFPIVLQGSGANAPFTILGGLNNTWVQGRRATRFFINDNLAWTVGAHELRFGTNTRIFRLNDYDFGEGVVPLVTYTNLPQFIYGIAATASKTFPLANSQPYNFLNLDLYAQDTWKLASKFTWTLGIRSTHNSNPLNPHHVVARLPGSFASIAHDVNQPLNAAIHTGLRSIFDSTPLAILQPRTAIAWQIAPKMVLRSGFGLFSDLLPGSIVDLVGVNPPYSRTFQGGLLGTVGGTAIAPGVCDSAVDATIAANQLFDTGFLNGQLSCASPLANPNACLQPVAITAVPDGKLHAPYFMQWSFGLEHQIGNTINLRTQYVGTRAVNQPYSTQVNGYQTVCDGCFSPFPYGAATDPRFAAVTQLNTGANSHYNGLQTTAQKRLGHGLQVQANYTWSHCMDTVSNGGFLPFAAGGILSPIPGNLQRDRGPCDYDVRHNVTARYVYELPVKLRGPLGAALNGWQVSLVAMWPRTASLEIWDGMRCAVPTSRGATYISRSGSRSRSA